MFRFGGPSAEAPTFRCHVTGQRALKPHRPVLRPARHQPHTAAAEAEAAGLVIDASAADGVAVCTVYDSFGEPLHERPAAIDTVSTRRPRATEEECARACVPTSLSTCPGRLTNGPCHVQLLPSASSPEAAAAELWEHAGRGAVAIAVRHCLCLVFPLPLWLVRQCLSLRPPGGRARRRAGRGWAVGWAPAHAARVARCRSEPRSLTLPQSRHAGWLSVAGCLSVSVFIPPCRTALPAVLPHSACCSPSVVPRKSVATDSVPALGRARDVRLLGRTGRRGRRAVAAGGGWSFRSRPVVGVRAGRSLLRRGRLEAPRAGLSATLCCVLEPPSHARPLGERGERRERR